MTIISLYYHYQFNIFAEYTTEVPLSKAPNPQLLPGRCSINLSTAPVCVHCVCVCVFTAVCVHFRWVKCRARVPSMGHHTWPHITSLHNHFTSYIWFASFMIYFYLYIYVFVIKFFCTHPFQPLGRFQPPVESFQEMEKSSRFGAELRVNRWRQMFHFCVCES